MIILALLACLLHILRQATPCLGQGGNATGGALYALDVLTGKAERLLDNWQGLAFNSPNDVVVTLDGTAVFFTDPSCGTQQGFRCVGFTLPFPSTHCAQKATRAILRGCLFGVAPLTHCAEHGACEMAC